MNILRTWKLGQLFQRIGDLCLGVILVIGMALSYGSTAQAAIATTSAATRADANQIEQRKEAAPHYPNWYEDQRSLESYMDRAGVDPNDRGNSPTDQNNDRGYNSLQQDRVNGYDRNSDQVSFADRSRDQVKDAYNNVRETLNPNSPVSGTQTYENSGATTGDIKDRVENRLERAKEVFEGATENAAEGGEPIITGESNR